MLYLALVDWASDKQTEQKRLDEYQQKQSTTFRDTLNIAAKTKRDREIMNNFEKIERAASFLLIHDSTTPDAAFSKFLDSWLKKNFGKMAETTMNRNGDSIKKQAGELRRMAELVELISFELLSVRQSTVARAEANVNVKAKTLTKEVKGKLTILAFRYQPNGELAMPQDEGNWHIQQNCIYSVINENFID